MSFWVIGQSDPIDTPKPHNTTGYIANAIGYPPQLDGPIAVVVKTFFLIFTPFAVISFLMTPAFAVSSSHGLFLSPFLPVLSNISVICSLTYCLRVSQFPHIGELSRFAFVIAPFYCCQRRYITMSSFRWTDTCWVASLVASLGTTPHAHWYEFTTWIHEEQRCCATFIPNLAASFFSRYSSTYCKV